MTTDEKFDLILNEIQTMKQDTTALKQDMTALKQDMTVLKQDMTALKQDMTALKQDMTSLKQSNLQTQMTLENTVNKCIQVMGEGFELNAERLDRFNVESIKNQSDLSYMIAKATSEKVDRLIEQLKKSA